MTKQNKKKKRKKSQVNNKRHKDKLRKVLNMIVGLLGDTENLKGHCHSDFAVFLSKLLKFLTKNLFSNMKLLLEHQEENI